MARKSTGAVIETKLADGTRSYAIRFRVNGERHYRTLGYSTEGWTGETAQEELANIMADVRRGIWREPEAEPPPVPHFYEFAEQWFEAQRLEGGSKGTGLSESGEADLRWRLEIHLLPFFVEVMNDPRLDEITVEVVDRYRNAKVRENERRRKAIAAKKPIRDKTGRALKPLSATTINMTLATLSAILERAVEYGHIASNPAKGKRRRLRKTKPVRTSLDRADHIAALLEAASERDASSRQGVKGHRRAVLATLVFAGLRIGEALALRWRDVDLARGVIRVRDAKTTAGVREVNMLPALRDELAAFRASMPEAAPSAFVFPTTKGARQSASNVRTRVLDKVIEVANAKLDETGEEPIAAITPHSLRRTFASLLFAIGEDAPYVMQQMGHTTPHLTLEVYARAMHRRDGEKDRLAALVRGDDWALTDQSPVHLAPNTAEKVSS